METGIFKFDELNERVQIKRKYRQYEAYKINSQAPIRNRIIEFVADRYVTNEELKNFLTTIEEDRGKAIDQRQWFNRNEKYFTSTKNEGQKMWSLSKFGRRIFEYIIKSQQTKINEMKDTHKYKITINTEVEDHRIGNKFYNVKKGEKVELIDDDGDIATVKLHSGEIVNIESKYVVENINESVNRIGLFKFNLNESVINEAAKENVSFELQSVKNIKSFVDLCSGKYLVIQSSGKIPHSSEKKINKGSVKQIFIIWEIESKNPKVANIYNGYGEFDSLINSRKGYHTIEEVYEFFKTNKSFDNRMYVTDKLPVISDCRSLKSLLEENKRSTQRLLNDTNDVTDIQKGKKVMMGTYVVATKNDYNSTTLIEFDYNGKGYTVMYDDQGERAEIKDGRRIAIAGYSRNETIFRVDKRICNQLYKLYEERIDLVEKIRSTIQNFIRGEKINPK